MVPIVLFLVPKEHSTEWGKTYDSWNESLRAHAREFAQAHLDSTILIFSSHATFSSVLDEPDAYGFLETDVRKKGGEIWIDRLHPTSKMHEWVARNLAQFLSEINSSA